MTNEPDDENGIEVTMYKVENNKIYIDEDFSILDPELSIFTLPVTGSFMNNVFIDNIYYYYPLHFSNIVTIKSCKGIRTIIESKDLLKKTVANNFMNQITIVMVIKTDETLTEEKFVNIKLFWNNSFQISGLKSTFQANYVINKIVRLLKGDFFVYTNESNKTKKIWESSNVERKGIKFIEGDEIWITAPTFSVINATYKYHSRINQIQFYYKMKELKLESKIPNNIEISFQSDIISPVSIWLPYENENGSKTLIQIYIFESRSISIMACKQIKHVVHAFNFITNILTTYNDYIVKKDLLSIITKNKQIMQHIDIEKLEKVADLY